MKLYFKISLLIIVMIMACGIASGGIFLYANILHKFNWSYYIIFLSLFSFISLTVTGSVILVLPWEREYEKMLAEGCGEEFSFYEACDKVTHCPPMWLLQLSRKQGEFKKAYY